LRLNKVLEEFMLSMGVYDSVTPEKFHFNFSSGGKTE
jgi:hypothetical protein